MKRKKLIIGALICIGFICLHSSCKKPVEGDCACILEVVHENNASIIGKWKLDKVRENFTASGPICYDYSKLNVMYEFEQDNFVKVSGNRNDHALESGKYSYSFTNNGSYGKMRLNNLTYWYKLSSKELILDLAPIDGATYYFVKK